MSTSLLQSGIAMTFYVSHYCARKLVVFHQVFKHLLDPPLTVIVVKVKFSLMSYPVTGGIQKSRREIIGANHGIAIEGALVITKIEIFGTAVQGWDVAFSEALCRWIKVTPRMEDTASDRKPVFHWITRTIVWIVKAPMSNRIRLGLRDLAEFKKVQWHRTWTTGRSESLPFCSDSQLLVSRRSLELVSRRLQ